MGSIAFWGTSSQGYEGPLYAPNAHDTVRIKGMQLPGVCKVKALPSQEFDREKAPGRDGATIILQGYLPGPIDIEMTLWTPEQWEKWLGIVEELWGTPGKLAGASKKQGAAAITAAAALAEQRALAIDNPALKSMKIARVVITGISLPEPGPFPQSRVINIKCLEYVPSPAGQAAAVIKGNANKAEEATAKYQFEKKNAGGTARKSPGRTDGGPNGAPRPGRGGTK